MFANQKNLLKNERIILAAHYLTVLFYEDVNLPARYRRQKELNVNSRKINDDSGIEKRFRNKVVSWANLIEIMISKIGEEKAWRFINIVPEFKGSETRITENKDFCDYIDYLILRRDVELCESEELGGLALLSVAFQREIEKRINDKERQVYNDKR